MTQEKYEKAKQLQEDIKSIDRQLKEKKEKRHWITTTTPNHEGASSIVFQNDLVKFLEETREKYQKEFDEL